MREQGEGWSEARLAHAEASLASAVDKADQIIAKARERAARDAQHEDDEMLDPLNRGDAEDLDEGPDDVTEPPSLLGDPAAPPAAGQRYLRDAW